MCTNPLDKNKAFGLLPITNSAVATISRLMEIGVTDYLLRSTLLGIVAQRLLRTLCTHCLAKDQISAFNWEQITRPMKLKLPAQINKAVGCLECRNTGYLGRVGIYEMMRVTPRLKEMIRTDVSHQALFEVAMQEGMVPLNVNGALKVAAGKTTPDEVMRVVSLT